MEFKGIKGKWEVVKDSDSVWIESDLWSIADVNKVGTLQEYKANAKLIAAAPKLLKALQEMLDLFHVVTDSLNETKQEESIIKSQKAINKALK